MFNHRPNVEDLREEMKSIDKNTLNRIIHAAEEELHRRKKEINKVMGITVNEIKVTIIDDEIKGELVIEDGKVRKLK